MGSLPVARGTTRVEAELEILSPGRKCAGDARDCWKRDESKRKKADERAIVKRLDGVYCPNRCFG